MTEKEMMNNEEAEINLAELFQILKSKYKIILLSIVFFAVTAGLVTTFLIEKKYQSTASLFLKPEVTNDAIDYTQLNVSDKMVNNYIVLLQGNNIQTQVATKLKMDFGELKSSLSISNTTNTQIIAISATTKDPELSQRIVSTMVEVFTSEVSEKLNVNNIITVDEPQINSSPVSPSLRKNVIIGALLGAFISIGIIFIKFMLDTHIHNKEEAEKYLGIPSLGTIPWFED